MKNSTKMLICLEILIMNLINLLIRELENFSLGAIFETRAMPKFVNLIAFLWKLISKEHVVVIMEFPDWVQVNNSNLHPTPGAKTRPPRQ